MAEYHYSPEFGTQIINDSDVDDSEVFRAFNEAEPELASMVRWTYDTRPSPAVRQAGLFERDRYTTPSSVYEQMRVAYTAAENDDVVSGVVETTEAMAFSRMSIECDDEDEEDIWDQISEDIDLDARMREMWREDFTVSNFYCSVYWGRASYKVRGKSDAGITRKKMFNNLQVPLGVSVLDPLKIVPVGSVLFNHERLAYAADRGEYDEILAVINGEREADKIISQLILEPYIPDETERRLLSQDGLPADRLFLLNPRNVFRHTSTRSQYQRFAPVRLKSVFALLDLKHQLQQMDRAHLLGATNFIVLVKKGSKERPALQPEINALQAQMRTLARVPVLVGDDRLSVEIITPQTDKTLDPTRYNGLNAGITARLYGMFMTGNFAAGAKNDDSLKLAKVVAKGLEARRDMIRRTVMREILQPTFEVNDAFTNEPSLRFHPKRIALDFDPTFATFLLDLRDRGDLSRESILEEVDFDQQVEWQRRKKEKEIYDDVFETTVPYSAATATPSPIKQNGAGGMPPGGGSPAPGVNPRAAARAGGRRAGGNKGGGGAAPGTGQGQAPKNALKKAK